MLAKYRVLFLLTLLVLAFSLGCMAKNDVNSDAGYYIAKTGFATMEIGDWIEVPIKGEDLFPISYDGFVGASFVFSVTTAYHDRIFYVPNGLGYKKAKLYSYIGDEVPYIRITILNSDINCVHIKYQLFKPGK